jgi:hypothetical protein
MVDDIPEIAILDLPLRPTDDHESGGISGLERLLGDQMRRYLVVKILDLHHTTPKGHKRLFAEKAG